jgi:hypothetical protein
MWIINFLPEWVFYLLVVVGILGVVCSISLNMLPFFDKYKLPVQVISVILLALGIYYVGAINNEKVWELKVLELEKKLLVAEAKAREENIKIETKVVERVRVVKQNVDVIKKEVEIQKEYINQGCELSDAAIEMYNRAVKNE